MKFTLLNIIDLFFKLSYFILFIYFVCAVQLVGSQFLEQGLNLDHGSESLES